MDYKSICGEVQQIALEAGNYIAGERKKFSSDKVEYKGVNNLVSYVDKTAEQLIVDRLMPLVDGAGFVTEEGSAGSVEGQVYRWIIDPLDGTTNFVHGISPYCVSIGLMEGDEVVVGVVYEITHQELFYAWKGSDAWMNGEKIAVSTAQKLADSLIAVGFSYAAFAETTDYIDLVAWYQRNSHGIRRLGSSTADLVYVACGRVDVFSQFGLSPWDVAAGVLIAQRAGAIVSDYKGGDNYVFGSEVVASTPAVYKEFMETLK